ncbi:MAG: hypothetical protein AAF587_40720 [Bacteroidota bacterium]
MQFSIDIQAEKSNIWEALWNEQSYRAWASVFYEGSYIIADHWEEGSIVYFLSPDQSGIYSIIETHIPHTMIRFRHIGNVINGQEQAIDEETKKWSGATEMYTLSEGTDSIILTAEIDVLDEHLDFMIAKLPIALEKVKDLSKN